MIGLVLAAGAGRRLRPDTDSLPKALLPVAGETTILDIALRNLAASGMTEAVIVVGHAAGAITDRAAALARAHRLTLTLVHNDRASDWNNAYSLWLAREHLAPGVLMVNGDTAHPASAEKTLLAARGTAGVILAIDAEKPLGRGGDEGRARRARAARQDHQTDGPGARARGVHRRGTDRGRRRGPARQRAGGHLAPGSGLYYEDGYQELADRGGRVAVAPIGAVDWVEVDNHEDLRRARQIAPHC